MGISRGTVGASVHKARGNLRTRLGNFGTFLLVPAPGRAVMPAGRLRPLSAPALGPSRGPRRVLAAGRGALPAPPF